MDVFYVKGSVKFVIEVGMLFDVLMVVVVGFGYWVMLVDVFLVLMLGGLFDKMCDLLGRNDKMGSSGVLYIVVIGSGGVVMVVVLKVVE